MIRLPLALVACVSVPLYLLGVLVMACLLARALPPWQRGRPAASDGWVRRSVRVAALVLLWPMWLLVHSCLQWREYQRCPLGTRACADPRVVSVQALITIRCRHWMGIQGGGARSPADGCEGQTPEGSRYEWFSSVPAALMATTLGIVAALPAPGLTFVGVYAAVTAATVLPLDALAAQMLRSWLPT